MTSSPDIRRTFFLECEELLEALDDGLNEIAGSMSESAVDMETINAVFRSVHSIKGGGAAFGLQALVRFAHQFETSLDAMRSGSLTPTEEIIGIYLRAADHLSGLVNDAQEERESPDGNGAELLERLAAFSDTPLAAAQPAPAFSPAPIAFAPVALFMGDDTSSSEAEFHIKFVPSRELFASGNDPVHLFRALEELGDLVVATDPAVLPEFDELEPHVPYMSWTLVLTTSDPIETVQEVFEFVDGICDIEIQQIAAAVRLPDEPPAEVTGATDPEDKVEVPPQNLVTAEAAPPPKASTPRRGGGSQGSVRVDLELVDRLINIVGELVINQSVLAQCIADIGVPTSTEVRSALEEFRGLASDIQESVMAIRAQPVKPLFQRMARIVREASDIACKKVRFETEGEGTEVDKTVIERLVDPLTHIIRNAVDHGLEHADRRRDAGKTESGCVTLSAAHRSGRVLIEVTDDGAGINRDRVLQIAIDKGLIPADSVLSNSEIDKLLFLPGFSTASEITDLSGRGVGMDVVRSAIEDLGGRVSITSTPGEGTTFSISLPLTLAVLDGMVVDVAGQTMVVPITAIVETLRPVASDLHLVGSVGQVVAVREHFVPIIDLAEVFGYRNTPGDFSDMVLLLVSTGEELHALAVDKIYDQRQVVIKGLEGNYGRVPGVAAATILGDGKIALIIDPDESRSEQRTASHPIVQFLWRQTDMLADSQTQEETLELVSFRVGDQDFCLDIMSIREIRGWTPATVLPHSPSYVLGVINLRGSVVPIVDLAARLGMASVEPEPRHVIVICMVEGQIVGFLVDSVSDILGIDPSEIQPTPDVTQESAHRFIKGVLAIEDRMLRLIDIASVLPKLTVQARS